MIIEISGLIKISKLNITDEAMVKVHPPLQTFINKVAEKKHLQKVVIEVDKNIVKYFGDQKFYNGFIREEYMEDCVRMTFLCGSLMGFSRWFMLFGDRAKIIEPLALNDMVAAIAENILKKIEESQLLLT